jgi:nitrogen fixation NifU-like protein
MGEGALDRYWAALKASYRETYSEVAADHMVFPRNAEQLSAYSGFGIINDDFNQTMAIWLNIEDGVITAAAFTSDDCTTCTACGSMATELAKGRTVAEALNISAGDVLEALGGLPEADEHCARLAADTLRTAIEDYQASAG